MRFMVIVKATEESESGAPPRTEDMAEMGRFNEELVKAGIMLAADGLLASSKGARIKFKDKERTIVDGPFAETKELVAGFWIIEVKDLEEAKAWMSRAPNPAGSAGGEAVIEIRQIAEMEDFPNIDDETRQAEERMRAQIAGKA